jgi:ABC-2 type transport system ATP-binding protein
MALSSSLRPQAPPAGGPLLLELTNLHKRYGQFTAVNGLSLGIRRGETLGLLGPNGAGKSTLMKLIVGALCADDGAVRFAGLAATELEARARIGIAPQEVALYPTLSAEENLAFFGRLYGLGGRRLRERVSYCLDIAGLEQRRKDRVGTFSGGMARRLNLCCAIVHEPDLVLLDEPTVGVDPHSRNHIFEALERLRSSGLTVLYSTHYMEEAERLCDRVAVIDRGRLLALGSVAELIRAHGGQFVVRVRVEGELPSELAALGASHGRVWTFATADPWALVNRFATAKLGIDALHVERPNLESVFLALTGRSLRD